MWRSARVETSLSKLETVILTIALSSHVQSQLRDLQLEQHQDVAEMIQELRRMLISNAAFDSGVSPSSTQQVIERDLIVPEALRGRFVAELENSETSFSIQNGLDALFGHFNGVSLSARATMLMLTFTQIDQDIDSMSYLRLMKSIWIMDKIRNSDDWKKAQRTNPGGLYDRCVREMDRVGYRLYLGLCVLMPPSVFELNAVAWLQ
jgi:hypothetical protein